MSAATPPDDDDKLLDALDAGEPARTPEETAARLPYQRLIERIQDLDEISPPPGWEERAEQRWRARRVDARKRRQRRAILGLSLGGAALAAALLLRPCASTPKPETPPPLVQAQVAIKTIHSGPPRRGDDVLVGDKLVAQAPVDGTHVELRIYLGDKLFARCPGRPECRRSAQGLEITLELTEEGTYRAVAFSSQAPIPEPGPDGYMDDVSTAQRAGAKHVPGDRPVTVGR
ncbi:MAG TPA: hypothetical protein VNO30_35640 [Kofleriaceae bacterium]|nr:hypothetical protein [Kofleriaceae bacterium]